MLPHTNIGPLHQHGYVSAQTLDFELFKAFQQKNKLALRLKKLCLKLNQKKKNIKKHQVFFGTEVDMENSASHCNLAIIKSNLLSSISCR